MKLQKNQIVSLLPGTYLVRDLEKEISQYLNTEEVLILYGARQVGKSSMVLHLAQQLIHKMPIYYYNLDQVDQSDIQSADRLLAALQEDLRSAPQTLLILDEAQRVTNIGLLIKQVYDKKLPLKIILTGSASFAIKSQISEPLTGRKFEFHLTPFTLSEIFRYHQLAPRSTDQPTAQLDQILHDYMLYGGYPNVFFTPDLNLKSKRLTEIVQSYITRDLVALFNISDVSATKKVTSYVADNIGNLLSIDKITSLGGLKRDLVQKILEALELTFVCLTIPPLSTSKMREVAKRPKIYFHDPGLRNAFLGKLDENLLISDLGALFENIIAIQLYSHLVASRLYYWRTINQTEVDFVIKHTKQGILGVETKYQWESNNYPKSLVQFMSQYQAKGMVIDAQSYWKFLELL